MKKTLLSLLPCAALLFASCGDSEYEVHETYFYPQKPNGIRVYADQQQDTIRLYSIDAWTLTSTTPEWLTVTPTSSIAINGSAGSTRLNLDMEKNATGQPRWGYIRVQAYDQIAMPVIQYSWLNVRQPDPQYYTVSEDLNNNIEDTRVRFDIQLKAQPVDTAIVFTVYQNDATLASSAEWVTISGTQFTTGQHRVKVFIAENEGTDKRNATLTLTSGGISTPINIEQSAN